MSEDKPAETTLPRAGPAHAHEYERPIEDLGRALIESGQEAWRGRTSKECETYLEEISTQFQEILLEFYRSANLCVDRFQQFSRSHKRWRITVILGSGLLAILNVLLVYLIVPQEDRSLGLWLPLLAAGWATVLAVLNNVESFYNPQEKAQAHRESRELFLSAYREFERLWRVYVIPFTNTPEACMNASELYRRIVAKDRELRVKHKELTKTERKDSGN